VEIKVGFDVDGVLADFHYGFSQILHTKFGTLIICQPQAKVWDFPQLQFGLTNEQTEAAWEDLKATPNWWEGLQPTWEFRECNGTKLANVLSQFPSYFVTSRVSSKTGRSVQNQTHRWLRDHAISHPNVIVVSNPSHKKEVVKALGITHFIEDKLETAIELAPVCNSYILDCKYNRDGDAAEGVRRVQSIDQYLQDIQDFCRVSLYPQIKKEKP